MALVNHAKREINAKIVYYGPENVGKATSLRYVHERIKSSLRGELKSLPTSGSSLLFFDFSPFEQPVFGGYRVRLHIYTLQGKVANPAAWKMTLKGADGLVVVADASLSDLPGSCESLLQLRDFLGSYGVGLHDIPFVLQLNKKDLNNNVSVEDDVSSLGLPECPYGLTSALNGEGVLEILTKLSKLVMERIGKREDLLLPDSTDVGRKTTVVSASTHFSGREYATFSADHLKVNPKSVVGPEPDSQPSHIPEVTLADDGVQIAGTTVKIPLNIIKTGGIQRVVVTVTVSTE